MKGAHSLLLALACGLGLGIGANLGTLSELRAAGNENCPNCAPGETPNTVSPAVLRPFANPAVQNAGTCRSETEQAEREAETEYAEAIATGGPEREAIVVGLPLKGTAAELALAAEIIGSSPPAAWKGATRCPDVLCALTQVFGTRESAQRAIVVGLRSGYVISASQELKNQRELRAQPKPGRPPAPAIPDQIFKPTEVRTIDRLLQKLPSSFSKLPTFRTFVRIPDGYALDGRPGASATAESATLADGRMTPGRILIRDVAFESGKGESILTHELTHQWDFRSLIDQRKTGRELLDWDRLSGWRDSTNAAGELVHTAGEGARFVSRYSLESPTEDLAEAVTYYVHRPEILKTVDPAKYALIRDRVFEGVEYPRQAWPALDRALQSAGGPSRAALACLSVLESIQRDSQTHYWEPASQDDPKSLTGRPLDLFVLYNRCTQKLSRQLAATLSQEPDFCANGGADGIERVLRERAVAVLYPMLRGTEDYLSSGDDQKSLQSCLDRKDLTSACFNRESVTALRARWQAWTGGVPLSFAKADLSAAEGEILRLLPLTALPSVAIAGDLSAEEILLACVPGLDQVVRDPDGRLNYREAESVRRSGDQVSTRYISARNPASLAGCRRGVIELIRSRGFAADADAIGNAIARQWIGKPEVEKSFASLAETLAAKLPEALRLCEPSERECRETRFRAVLAAWAFGRGYTRKIPATTLRQLYKLFVK